MWKNTNPEERTIYEEMSAQERANGGAGNVGQTMNAADAMLHDALELAELKE